MKNSKTIKLFWIYRALSYDLIFYYTIATLFYTTIKGSTLSQVMLVHSFAAIFTFIFLIPAHFLIKKIGNTLSIRIGTFLWILYLTLTIFLQNVYAIFVIEAICSMGTVLKILSDSNIIVNTLELHGESKRYVDIESKSITTYFVLDCIAALLAGYLFKVNGYLPMILCLISVIISFVISFFIKDETEIYSGLKYKGRQQTKQSDENSNGGIKSLVKNKNIIKFLIYVITFYGLIMSAGYMQNIGLVDIKFSSVTIGYIAVGAKIINALSSLIYDKIHTKIKNYFPIITSFIFLLTTLTIGLIYTFLPNSIPKFIALICMLLVLEFFKQPYKIFAKDYIRTNSTGAARQTFYTIYFMCEVSGDFLLCLLGSIMLESQTVGITYIILFAVTIVPILISSFILSYHLRKTKNLNNQNTNSTLKK